MRPCTLSGAKLFRGRCICRSDTPLRNLPAPDLDVFASNTKAMVVSPSTWFHEGLTARSAFSSYEYLVQGSHSRFLSRRRTQVPIPDPAWRVLASARLENLAGPSNAVFTRDLFSQLRYIHICSSGPCQANRTSPARRPGRSQVRSTRAAPET